MIPMQTIKYMSWYINTGGPSLGEKARIVPAPCGSLGFCEDSPAGLVFKSVHAAKCAVARYMRKGLSEEAYRLLKKGV